MNRFNCGILFSVVVTIVLAGLSAAIVHPYVHALKNAHHVASHHVEVPDHDQGILHIDTADNCYVCTFSKNLTFDQPAITEFNSDVVTDRVHPLLSIHFRDVLNFSFFLRGPPLI